MCWLTEIGGEMGEKASLDFHKGISSPLEGWYTSVVNISSLWSRWKQQPMTQTPPFWVVKKLYELLWLTCSSWGMSSMWAECSRTESKGTKKKMMTFVVISSLRLCAVTCLLLCIVVMHLTLPERGRSGLCSHWPAPCSTVHVLWVCNTLQSC